MPHPGNNTPDTQETEGSDFRAGIDERKNLRLFSFPALNDWQSTYQLSQTAPNRSEYQTKKRKKYFVNAYKRPLPLNKTSGRY